MSQSESPYKVESYSPSITGEELNRELERMKQWGWDLLTMDSLGRAIFGRKLSGRSPGTHYYVDVKDQKVRIRLHARGSKIFDTIDNLWMDGSNAFEEMDRVLSGLTTPSMEVAGDLYLAIKSVLEKKE